ncbi:MAG: MFS transporter [Opitutales bacterium]
MSLRALELPNVRHFVRFRIFFNARYYYPIFAVLFIDYGLTLEQFTTLNVLWAVTIVLAEVPSGALADVIGRRTLLLIGASLMCLEMLVLLVAPIGGGTLTLILFAINRVASGLAEAMVSGADEALTYDTLQRDGDPGEWTALLEFLGKRIALVMGFVMVIGALFYDPNFVNVVTSRLGFEVPSDWLLRVPIALTLLHGFVALYSAWAMKEVEPEGHAPVERPLRRLGKSFVRVWGAMKWLASNRFLLFVVLSGLIIDSVARQYVILNSEYYRLIGLPEFSYGFLSAALAAAGFLFAKFNRYLADRHAPLSNLLILSAILVFGLVGAAFHLPYVGVVFVPFIVLMFSSVSFLQSTYLNREADSSMRATLLSFRGLASNLGLALASQLYAVLIWSLKQNYPDQSGDELQQTVFADALAWFAPSYLVLLGLVLLGGRLFIRRRDKAIQVPA